MPPAGAEKLSNLNQIPRPYLIEAPEMIDALGQPSAGRRQQYEPGECFDFRLILIGRAAGFFPYFLFTFCRLGETGLGPGRGQYKVAEVQAETMDQSQLIYTDAEGKLQPVSHTIAMRQFSERMEQWRKPLEGNRRLTIRFVTPTRLVSDGDVCMKVPFQEFVRGLLRRLSSLCYFHCNQELAVDFSGLKKQAATIGVVDSSLRWHRQERFSGRQQQWIDMSGLMGTVTYQAPSTDAWELFLPLLAAGEWVHVGKGCVMGLGKYQVEVTP